jgi:hypothetical protein
LLQSLSQWPSSRQNISPNGQGISESTLFSDRSGCSVTIEDLKQSVEQVEVSRQ